MAIRVAEVIAIDVSLNTDRINKDVNKVNRLLKQVQGAYSGVRKELATLDAAFKTGKIAEEEYLAVKNRLNLAAEKARQKIRDEAAAIREATQAQKELTRAKRAAENKAAGLLRQRERRGPERADARRASATAEEFAVARAALRLRLSAYKEEQAAQRQVHVERMANEQEASRVRKQNLQIERAAADQRNRREGLARQRNVRGADFADQRRAGATEDEFADSQSALQERLQRYKAERQARRESHQERMAQEQEFARVRRETAREEAAARHASNRLEGRNRVRSREGAALRDQVRQEREAIAVRERRAELESRIAPLRQTRIAQENAIRLNQQIDNDLQQEGLQYMQQFENRVQRRNRLLGEAHQLFRRGVLTQNQYAVAARSITLANSVMGASFAALKSTMLAVIGPLVILYKTAELVKKSIDLSAELDQSRAKFKIFTGSVEEANAVLADLRTLSSESPVSFQAGTRAAATLLQFGVEGKRVNAVVRELSEIVGGNKERMEALALAYAQSQAAGRLMGQELLQMVNAGFNPLLQISEETGESFQSLKKRMEEGGISSELVAEQFTKATAEGGKFNGLLEEMGGTTAGRLIKMNTELEKLGTAVGQAIGPITDFFAVFVTDQAKAIQTVINNAKELNVVMKALKLTADIDDATGGGVGSEDGLGKKGGFDRFRDNLGVGKESAFGKNLGLALEAKEKVSFIDSLFNLSLTSEDVSKASSAALEFATLYGASFNDAFSSLPFLGGFKDVLSVDEQIKQMEDFQNTFGFGYEEELKGLKARKAAWAAIRAEVELAEAAEAKRLATQKRSEEAFADAIKDAEEQRVEDVYGSDAERVNLIRDASVDDERKTIDDLIEQEAKYEDILAVANESTKAEVARLEALEKINKATEDAEKNAESTKEWLEQQREEYNRIVAEQEKERDRIKDIIKGQSQTLEIAKARLFVSKEEARIRELVRDQNLSRGDAETVAGLEKQAKAYERLQDIKDKANSSEDFIKQIAALNIALDEALITQEQFDKQREEAIAGQLKGKTSSGFAENIEQGSQAAFKAFYSSTASDTKKQLKELEVQTVLATNAAAIAQAQLDQLTELNLNQPATVGL